MAAISILRLPAATRLPPRWRRCSVQASAGESGHAILGPQRSYRCRVYAATDLHVDYERNFQWLRELSTSQYRHDVLIVAGDVSDDLRRLEEALGELATKFGWVLYTPGNHELWLRQQDLGFQHSLQKLEAVWDLCARLGVHTAPLRVGGGLWVVPLLSWHHQSFDTEPDIPGIPPATRMTIADFAACKWPAGLGEGPGSLALAEWFDAQNDSPAWSEVLRSRGECDVISFSHFLPSQALLPEKRFLYYPNLAKAVGSVPLGARVRRLRPDIHVFGHSHFAWDATIDGVRYIQAPLCSPIERQRRLLTIGFEASMAEAQADPEAASWLPLQIYECSISAADLPTSPTASTSHSSNNSSSVLGGSGSQLGSMWGPSLASGLLGIAGSSESGSAAGSGSLDAADGEELESIDHAMHGLPTSDSEEDSEGGAPAPQPPDDELARGGLGAAVPSSSSGAGGGGGSGGGGGAVVVRGAAGLDVAEAVAATGRVQSPVAGSNGGREGGSTNGGDHGTNRVAGPGVRGPVQLRHGSMPGYLGAHWSHYFLTHERDPSNTTLAPWVARVYERRLKGKKGGAAAAAAPTSPK